MRRRSPFLGKGTITLVVYWLGGATLHFMSVTPTPYGASNSGTTFSCLLSDPDTGLLNSLLNTRHILRGSNVGNFPNLALPNGYSTSSNVVLDKKSINLPAREEAQGMYFCEATSSGITTRVPVTILANNRRFQPANGKFTYTASVGDSVTLDVELLETPADLLSSTPIYWQKQADLHNNFGQGYSTIGGTTLVFNSVSVSDAGAYATFWQARRTDFRFSLIRLIVRECAEAQYGPPSCLGVCDNCYNGGICDDKTGECVCRPGFMGPNCLTACGTNKFGWDCEHQCGPGLALESCTGSVFCMPDPVGCSCMSGYMGTDCFPGCPDGKFGAGCTEDCNCAAGSCDIFTGECTGGCNTGWSGTSCQIPDICPAGYYGNLCLEKCLCQCDQVTGSCFDAAECLRGYYGADCNIVCNCLNAAACSSETGECEADITTGLSLCQPGYVSSTGNNLDNCQFDEGCYDSCTKTCHCANGKVDCNSATGCQSGQCRPNWTGPFCLTGIVDLTYMKTNPNQPVRVTCTVTGDPDVPDASDVSLRIGATASSCSQVGSVNMGGFLAVTFEAISAEWTQLRCIIVQLQEDSTKTAALSVITPEYYVPGVPRNILARRGSQDDSIVISWDPPDSDSPNGNIIFYHIHYWQSSNAEMEFRIRLEGNKLTHTIDGLEMNSTYNIQMQAESNAGKGPWSDTVTIVLFPKDYPVPADDSETQGQVDSTVVITVSVTACTVILVLSVIIVGVLFFIRMKSTRSNDTYENGGVDTREGIAMTNTKVGYQSEVQDQAVDPGYEVHLPGPRSSTVASGYQGADYEVVPGPEPSGYYEDLKNMGIYREEPQLSVLGIEG